MPGLPDWAPVAGLLARVRALSQRVQAREALGLESFAQLRFSWLDVKLGLRMLVKHPMLNLAAVFALGVGIPVGLAPSHLARALEAPLPGDADDRVRAIRHWDPLSSAVAPTWDGEFTFWEETLRRFSSLGAFRTSSYNVASADGLAAPVAGAQLSSSIFQMLSARPLLGRVLEAGDFAAGAPDVVVIGHGLWSSRFGQDPDVLGRSIRVGRNLHVVVGVMPDGFAFPTNEALWLPLRLASDGGVGERMRVQILGRLADGVSAEQAQAELSSQVPPLTSAASANEAAERARLRAEVVPFGMLKRSLVQIGLGAAIGLPIATRFVFELTSTPGNSGSAPQSVAIALGLSTGIVALVGLGSCLVPTRRILAVQPREAMHAEG